MNNGTICTVKIKEVVSVKEPYHPDGVAWTKFSAICHAFIDGQEMSGIEVVSFQKPSLDEIVSGKTNEFKAKYSEHKDRNGKVWITYAVERQGGNSSGGYARKDNAGRWPKLNMAQYDYCVEHALTLARKCDVKNPTPYFNSILESMVVAIDFSTIPQPNKQQPITNETQPMTLVPNENPHDEVPF